MNPAKKYKPIVLILQGPLSSFYSEIAGYLAEAGIAFHKVHICGNDIADWHHQAAINYSGRLEDWETFLDETAKQLGITHILMHADRRPYHKVAVEWAKNNEVEVMVTELGYLRPDWMTIEPWGTSSLSRFPKDPEVIRNMAEGLHDFDPKRKYKDSLLSIIVQETRWTFFNLVYSWRFPYFKTHRSQSPWLVYPGWLLTKLKTVLPKPSSNLNFSQKKPYYVMALQLEGDFQLRDHSPFDSMAQGVKHVVQSFAAHAPEGSNLILKLHPNEFNRRSLSKQINTIIDNHGLSSRISMIENIPIAELCKHSKGFVTINSSAGFEALSANCPTHTVCRTIYSIEDLTFQGEIDDFWREGEKPDLKLLNCLRKALDNTIQVRGNLYNEKGRKNAAKSIADKLYSAQKT